MGLIDVPTATVSRGGNPELILYAAAANISHEFDVFTSVMLQITLPAPSKQRNAISLTYLSPIKQIVTTVSRLLIPDNNGTFF